MKNAINFANNITWIEINKKYKNTSKCLRWIQLQFRTMKKNKLKKIIQLNAIVIIEDVKTVLIIAVHVELMACFVVHCAIVTLHVKICISINLLILRTIMIQLMFTLLINQFLQSHHRFPIQLNSNKLTFLSFETFSWFLFKIYFILIS